MKLFFYHQEEKSIFQSKEFFSECIIPLLAALSILNVIYKPLVLYHCIIVSTDISFQDSRLGSRPMMDEN